MALSLLEEDGAGIHEKVFAELDLDEVKTKISKLCWPSWTRRPER